MHNVYNTHAANLDVDGTSLWIVSWNHEHFMIIVIDLLTIDHMLVVVNQLISYDVVKHW